MTLAPSIPVRPCFICGALTSETQSAFGVGHEACYAGAVRSSFSHVLPKQPDPLWYRHMHARRPEECRL